MTLPQHRKILHIGKFFYPYRGGIENFLGDLAAEQALGGNEVLALVHHERLFKPSATGTANGIRVVRAVNLGQMVYAPVAPTFGLQLAKLMKSFKPDILHVHLPNLSAFWALLIRASSNLILHWHADVVPSTIDKRLSFFYPCYRLFERKLLQQCRAVIVTSKDYLEASQPLAAFKHKCHVIPLGLNTARLHQPTATETAAMRSRFGAGPLVLSVGRFTYYKGFQYLIEAARQVPGATFVVVGKGPLRKPLQKKITALGLEHRVLLPGLLSDAELHALMAACDIFCLPSVERTEAFGLVLLEAMAFGKPLITTAIHGSATAWVNQHQTTGLVVPPADSAALAQALTGLLNVPQARHTMGEQAAERLARCFHIQQVAKSIGALYSTLQTPPSQGR